jgi:hypothetical protein
MTVQSTAPKTSVHVEWANGEAGRRIQVIGGGGSLRVLGVLERQSGDTVIASTPTTFVVDLKRGAVEISALRDTSWISINVITPSQNRISASANRLRITSMRDRIEVTALPKNPRGP